MKPLVIGSLFASLALFIWSLIFWGVFPFAGWVQRPLPDEAAVVIPKLREHLPASGYYRYPAPKRAASAAEQQAASELYQRRQLEGPLFELIYRRQGINPLSIGTMFWRVVHCFLTALAAGWLLKLASPVLPDYRRRALFVLMLGVLAIVMTRPEQPIWFHHPASLAWLLAVCDLGKAAILAAILARFVQADVAIVE